MDFWCDDAALAVTEAVRDDWDAFLQAAPEGAVFEVVHDGDVDGLCAAAIAHVGLAALGFQAMLRRVEGAGMHVPPGVQGRIHLARREPSRQMDNLFCLTCEDDDDKDPVRAFILWALFDERCAMQTHAWLPAVALLQRHGAQANMPFLKAAKARHTCKALKQVLTWLKLAPHAHCDLTPRALHALCTHRDARTLCRSNAIEVGTLREAEVAITQAQNASAGATPHLSGHLALIRMRSACQVQALVAQDWSRKLPGYLVMVANEGANDVRLATCSHSALSPSHFLRSLALPIALPDDGIMSRAAWTQALRALGIEHRPLLPVTDERKPVLRQSNDA